MIVASAMAMLLTTGMFALVLGLPDWWRRLWDAGDPWIIWPAVWAALLLLWAVWAWVFFVYWRHGDCYTQLSRMIRGLVAGSLLEVLVAVPVHAWATRQREC